MYLEYPNCTLNFIESVKNILLQIFIPNRVYSKSYSVTFKPKYMFFYKHNVYKHTEAQIPKKLTIFKHISEPHFCILTVKSNWLP